MPKRVFHERSVGGWLVAAALMVFLLVPAGCDEQQASVPEPARAAPRKWSEGERVYTIFCANCHGTGGYGTPNLATQPWVHVQLDGSPEEDLVRTAAQIRDYEEGSGMAAYGEVLTEEEILAVAAYVLSLRKPAGEAERPPEPQ